ncbi:MAG: glycoside hydrolase family 2 [Bacteroidales bacterium]|nr:glycoside hydrolase family 2 [Bacteroidales bacterium]
MKIISVGLLAVLLITLHPLRGQEPVTVDSLAGKIDPEKQHLKGPADMITPWAENFNSSCPLPEYPRPVMERKEWLNLNGLWEFQEAAEGERLPSGKKLKELIVVPFPWESKLSGIHRQIASGRAFYRRTLDIPETWKGKRLLLHFGAVDYESVIYINGQYAGWHQGGYDPFTVDITRLIRQKGPQELIVSVYDPGSDQGIAAGKQTNIKFSEPKGYSYTPSSGIWQTVWLEPVGDVYIHDIHVIPDIDRKVFSVRVMPPFHTGEHEVTVSISADGKPVGSGSGLLNSEIVIPLSEVRLWSPVSPFLYDIEIVLQKDDSVVDVVNSYAGMRKISLGDGPKGLKQIFLNNEFLFQMGPLDQGFWPDGLYTAPSDEALRWDIEQMKEFGYNMVRKHIKIEPQRWYYWCDKLGLLVWQDMPSTFKQRTEDEKTQFETELQLMVKTHWNHPSIVNWIIFNEHWGLYDPVRLTENIMALDPSRLVTGNSGIDAGRPNIDYVVGHITDNHSYRPPNVPFASQTRATVCGEYGAIGYKIQGHIWDIDGPWVHHNYEGIDDATTEYEKFIKMIIDFQNEGLSAAVYTQWTDVENEMNGIFTYDRKVIKLYQERIRKANESTYLIK